MITAKPLQLFWGAQGLVGTFLVPDLLVLCKYGTADETRRRPARPVTREPCFSILAACGSCSKVLTVDWTAGFSKVPTCDRLRDLVQWPLSVLRRAWWLWSVCVFDCIAVVQRLKRDLFVAICACRLVKCMRTLRLIWNHRGEAGSTGFVPAPGYVGSCDSTQNFTTLSAYILMVAKHAMVPISKSVLYDAGNTW